MAGCREVFCDHRGDVHPDLSGVRKAEYYVAAHAGKRRAVGGDFPGIWLVDQLLGLFHLA